jgi:hypothetical protein
MLPQWENSPIKKCWFWPLTGGSQNIEAHNIGKYIECGKHAASCCTLVPQGWEDKL